MSSPRIHLARPYRTWALLAAALAMGGAALAEKPARPRVREAFGGTVPRYEVVPPLPRAFGVAPNSLSLEFGGATDRCLIEVPRLDERFVVAAPRVDDRFVVASRVQGLPLGARRPASAR